MTLSQTLHVLLLDDAEVVRRALTRRLESAGYRVWSAGRNEEALAHLLRAHKGQAEVDLLIQDHERPEGGDGTAMVKVLRRMYADRAIQMTGVTFRALPILVLSGHPESCAPTLASVDPYVRVLSKNSTEKELSDAILDAATQLQARILTHCADAGARITRSHHGWVADVQSDLHTDVFHGDAEQLERTLHRLDPQSRAHGR